MLPTKKLVGFVFQDSLMFRFLLWPASVTHLPTSTLRTIHRVHCFRLIGSIYYNCPGHGEYTVTTEICSRLFSLWHLWAPREWWLGSIWFNSLVCPSAIFLYEQKYLKVGVFPEASLAPTPWSCLQRCLGGVLGQNEGGVANTTVLPYRCTRSMVSTDSPRGCVSASLGNRIPLAVATVLSMCPFILVQQPTVSPPCFQLTDCSSALPMTFHSLSFPLHHFPRSSNCLCLPNNPKTASIGWVPTLWQMLYIQNLAESSQQHNK